MRESERFIYVLDKEEHERVGKLVQAEIKHLQAASANTVRWDPQPNGDLLITWETNNGFNFDITARDGYWMKRRG